MIKQKNQCGLYFILTIILILLVGSFIYYKVNVRIDSIENEHDNMPKRICTNKIVIEKKIIEPSLWSAPYISYIWFEIDCSKTPDSMEISCEEGIKFDSCFWKFLNYNNKSGVCIIKTNEEVCEIK